MVATATAAPDTAASGSARQLDASRRVQMPLSHQTHSQQDLSQRQPQLPQQQQQQAPASLQGKAERALAKLQQDRGRPVQSPTGGGRDPPPVIAKVRAGREAGGIGGISGSGGGSGAQASCGGLAPSGLYDTDAALDPPGNARVGGDAPLSANMEPDLLGFVALSMIQVGRYRGFTSREVQGIWMVDGWEHICQDRISLGMEEGVTVVWL